MDHLIITKVHYPSHSDYTCWASYLASKFSLLLDGEHNWACLGSEVDSEESLWRNTNLMETRWWRRQKAAERVGSSQQLVVRWEIFSRLSSNKPASKLLTHACSATSHSYWSPGHTQHQITPDSTFPVEFLNFDILVHCTSIFSIFSLTRLHFKNLWRLKKLDFGKDL